MDIFPVTMEISHIGNTGSKYISYVPWNVGEHAIDGIYLREAGAR